MQTSVYHQTQSQLSSNLLKKPFCVCVLSYVFSMLIDIELRIPSIGVLPRWRLRQSDRLEKWNEGIDDSVHFSTGPTRARVSALPTDSLQGHEAGEHSPRWRWLC